MYVLKCGEKYTGNTNPWENSWSFDKSYFLFEICVSHVFSMEMEYLRNTGPFVPNALAFIWDQVVLLMFL